MTSNFLSTLDFTVSHPDSGSTGTEATDNGGNPGDTQPIPKGSPSPDRSPLGSNTSTKLFANAGENEMESAEFERVLVSTDGVFYKNQADDIRSNIGDLRTVWSQETISITPKKHNNRLAELIKQVREFKADNHKDDDGEQNRSPLSSLNDRDTSPLSSLNDKDTSPLSSLNDRDTSPLSSLNDRDTSPLSSLNDRDTATDLEARA